MGDTHAQLATSLAKVDAGMKGLGLTPAGMEAGAMGNTGAYGRKAVEGWRNIVLMFAKTELDCRNGNATNIQEKFKDVYYERNLGTILLTKTNGFGVSKSLLFELNNVVADPTENEVYEVVRLENKGLGNVQLDASYQFCMLQKITGSKSAH